MMICLKVSTRHHGEKRQIYIFFILDLNHLEDKKKKKKKSNGGVRHVHINAINKYFKKATNE